MGKSKLLTAVIILLLGFFLIYQLYSVFYNPISTEIVTQYTATDGVNITGIIIRDEELISGNSSAALHFEVEDSARVAKDGVIADIYATEAQSIAATRAKEIEKEISSIEEIEKYNDLNAVDINLLNSKFYACLNSFIAKSNTGRFTALSDDKNEMINLINRKQLATGNSIDFSAQLASLKEELSKVRSQAGSPSGSIKAPKSGYFVSTADGYEGVLTTDKLNSITPEFIDGLKPDTASSDSSVIGKLVSNYTWYIAAVVSIDDSVLFKKGDSLTIKTDIKSNSEINVEVYGINMSAADDRAVVIFSCQEMSGELSSVRSGAMTVVRSTYSGLKVSSKALRMINKEETDENGNAVTKSVTGVYVITGMTANFVPVNIIYSDEGYAICEYSSEDGNLRLYDEIIVKGKNIYDGKIID